MTRRMRSPSASRPIAVPRNQPPPRPFSVAIQANRRTTMADKDTPQEVAAKFIEKLKASPFVMIGLNDGAAFRADDRADRRRSAQHAVLLHRHATTASPRAARRWRSSSARAMISSPAWPATSRRRQRPHADRQALEQPGRGMVSGRQGRPQPRAAALRHRQRRAVGNRHLDRRPPQDAVRRHDPFGRSRAATRWSNSIA